MEERESEAKQQYMQGNLNHDTSRDRWKTKAVRENQTVFAERY